MHTDLFMDDKDFPVENDMARYSNKLMDANDSIHFFVIIYYKYAQQHPARVLNPLQGFGLYQTFGNYSSITFPKRLCFSFCSSIIYKPAGWPLRFMLSVEVFSGVYSSCSSHISTKKTLHLTFQTTRELYCNW